MTTERIRLAAGVLLISTLMASCAQGSPMELVGAWQDQKFTNNQLVFTDDYDFFETYLGETICNGT